MTCPVNCHNARVVVLDRVLYRRGRPQIVHFKTDDCPFCTASRSMIVMQPRRYMAASDLVAIYPELHRLIRQFPKRKRRIDSVLAMEVAHHIRPRRPKTEDGDGEEEQATDTAAD